MAAKLLFLNEGSLPAVLQLCYNAMQGRCRSVRIFSEVFLPMEVIALSTLTVA